MLVKEQDVMGIGGAEVVLLTWRDDDVGTEAVVELAVVRALEDRMELLEDRTCEDVWLLEVWEVEF